MPNQGLHGQLCIESTQPKNFTAPHCCTVIFPRRTAGGAPLWYFHIFEFILHQHNYIIFKKQWTASSVLCACKIVTHNHASSVHFLSKAAHRSIYSNSATTTWTPFLSIFWLVIAGKVSYRCTHTSYITQTYLFTFPEYWLYQNTTFYFLIYTSELRGQGSL